jgi:hypothetical protein
LTWKISYHRYLLRQDLKKMPLSFSTEPEEPLLVEDASEEEQVEFEAAFEEEEEEMGDEKSITSASEFEGDLGELPERMLFGELECRAVFTLKSDNGSFHRVCGCRATDCTRDGHTALRLSGQGRGLEGTYEPVKARRYVDGSLLLTYLRRSTLRKLLLSSKNVEPAWLLQPSCSRRVALQARRNPTL